MPNFYHRQRGTMRHRTLPPGAAERMRNHWQRELAKLERGLLIFNIAALFTIAVFVAWQILL